MLPRGFRSRGTFTSASTRHIHHGLVSSRQFSSSPAVRIPHASLGASRSVLRSKCIASFAGSSTRPVAVPFLLSLPSQARLQSTSSPAATLPTASASTPSPADITPDFVPETLNFNPYETHLQATEHIGYLKSIGLDYGWGPTSFLEWTLEHIHVLSGTPWWASIMMTAAVTRLIMLPFMVMQSDVAARQTSLKSVIEPATRQMNQAMRDGDSLKMMAKREELHKIYKRGGIKLSRAFLPILIQAPLGFASFKLLRAMAALPVPGLETGGFGWITDLTIADPYFAVPAALAASMYINIHRGYENAAPGASVNPQMQSAMLYGLPAITFAVTVFMPAGLQLSFATNSIIGMAFGRTIQNHTVRRALGIAIPYRSDPGKSAEENREESLRSVGVGAGAGAGVKQELVPGSRVKMQGSGAFPNTAADVLQVEDQAKGMVKGKIDDVKGWLGGLKKGIVEGAASMSGRTVEKGKIKGAAPGGREISAARRRAAEDYEKRRRREIAEERQERRGR